MSEIEGLVTLAVLELETIKLPLEPVIEIPGPAVNEITPALFIIGFDKVPVFEIPGPAVILLIKDVPIILEHVKLPLITVFPFTERADVKVSILPTFTPT
jgi:hypothetical protein